MFPFVATYVAKRVPIYPKPTGTFNPVQ